MQFIILKEGDKVKTHKDEVKFIKRIEKDTYYLVKPFCRTAAKYHRNAVKPA